MGRSDYKYAAGVPPLLEDQAAAYRFKLQPKLYQAQFTTVQPHNQRYLIMIMMTGCCLQVQDTSQALPSTVPATATDTDTQPKVEMATTTNTQVRDEKPTGEVLTGEVDLIPLLPPSRPKDHPPGPQDIQLEQQSSSKATLSSATKRQEAYWRGPHWRG